MKRIVLSTLLELQRALHTGDGALLRRCGLTRHSASHLGATNLVELAEALASDPTVFRITIDGEGLRSIASGERGVSLADVHRRALIDTGATQAMLVDMGLWVSRSHFRAMVSTVPGGYRFGRPSALDEKTIRQMHRYWDSCAEPWRIHPVDHLLRTAEHLNLRVASVWNYLRSYPRAIDDGNGSDAPPGWALAMFPLWRDAPLSSRGTKAGAARLANRS